MTADEARAAIAVLEDEIKGMRPDPLGEGWVAATGGGVYLITGPGSAPVVELVRVEHTEAATCPDCGNPPGEDCTGGGACIYEDDR